MKNILLSLAATTAFVTLLCSCAKEETPNIEPYYDTPAAEVVFITEENEASRAFFDPSATTEAWEKSLSSLTVFCFGEDGNLLVRRNFTSDEIAARTSTFALPRTSAGKNVEFYALANTAVDESVTTKAALTALVESAPENYNGTFTDVSTKALRSGGFLMSGSAAKAVAASGAATQVAITLKRDVAKVAVQTSLSEEFASRYPGSVTITSAKISRAAMQTPYFSSTVKPGAMTYAHTQTPGTASGKFNSLFYLFENGTLASGSRVLLTLEGIYDRDGKSATSNDQIPVTYEVELAGSSNNGQLMRNGYYRVAVSLTGLTGQDVTASITVAPWETPATQTISLGK